MKWLLIYFLPALLLVGCSEEKDTAAAPAPVPALHAEQLVTPVPGQFLAACLSEDQLNELILHSINKETTKFRAMFDRMECVRIPEGQTYKILAVHDARVEFTFAKNAESDGLWAVEEAFKAQ